VLGLFVCLCIALCTILCTILYRTDLIISLLHFRQSSLLRWCMFDGMGGGWLTQKWQKNSTVNWEAGGQRTFTGQQIPRLTCDIHNDLLQPIVDSDNSTTARCGTVNFSSLSESKFHYLLSHHSETLQLAYHHHHNHFTALFPGPPGWAGARRELLDFMMQGKINRGRHTDHPVGRHSIRTNQ